MMRVILSNAPVRVLRDAVVVKSNFGRREYVKAGDIVFCLCAQLSQNETMSRVRLSNRFIGDIKRTDLKPLGALELLGAMCDAQVDGNYDEEI
jgi:hypothetical protein